MSINKVIEYFDLASEYRPGGSRAVADQGKLHWLPQYVAVLAGIMVQPYFARYMAAGHWDLKGFWGWLFASIVIALMAFPAVYKDSLDPTKPLFVQMCVIFTSGTGWQTLVSTALKAAGVAVTGAASI
jgi:hypothetical protein